MRSSITLSHIYTALNTTVHNLHSVRPFAMMIQIITVSQKKLVLLKSYKGTSNHSTNKKVKMMVKLRKEHPPRENPRLSFYFV